MEETYHIEFRYGKNLEELQGYLVGPYAYWLAAGIDEAADEETINRVIALFCLENMDYSAHTEAALRQLAELGFVGSWKADLYTIDFFRQTHCLLICHALFQRNEHTVSDVLISLRCPVGHNVTILMTLPHWGCFLLRGISEPEAV